MCVYTTGASVLRIQIYTTYVYVHDMYVHTKCSQCFYDTDLYMYVCMYVCMHYARFLVKDDMYVCMYVCIYACMYSARTFHIHEYIHTDYYTGWHIAISKCGSMNVHKFCEFAYNSGASCHVGTHVYMDTHLIIVILNCHLIIVILNCHLIIVILNCHLIIVIL
jgi:hypothetical protein